MLHGWKLKITLINVGLWAMAFFSFSQVQTTDTVFVAKGQILLLSDTLITPGRDTVIILAQGQKYKVKQDPQLQSQAFYDSLQVKSKRGWLMDELYQATIINQNAKILDTTNPNKPELVYKPYNGFTIREIHLAQVDLISGSVIDTSIHATEGLPKLLNNTHINTKESVIRKNLIFKEGETIDANRMVENERYLRSLRFIDDARILLIPVGENQVDVLVITKDLFPISFSITGSNYNDFSVTLNHRNIAGTGQGVRDRVIVDGQYNPLIGNRLDYELNNIAKTFTNFNLRILTTPEVTNGYAKLSKGFITPETKYAGGLEVQYLRDNIGLAYPDSTVEYEYALTSQNIWLGRSFMLNEAKRSNLLLTAKFSPIHHQKRPVVTVDSNQIFQNSNLLLGSVSFLQYKTVKTRYLKSFGRVEDVPFGFLASFTAGYLYSDIWALGYTSFRTGYAKSFNNGSYIQIASNIGSYFNKLEPVQGLAFFKTEYFSPLIKIYNSQLRFVGSIQYKNGVNRFKYEWINLNDEVRGLSSKNSSGTSKTAFTTEAVLFTNSFIYGFRLAPYVFANYGLIRYYQANPYKGIFYSGIGIGLRIRNESLVFQTLDISFAVYPSRQTGDKLYRVMVETSEPDIFNDIKVGEPYVMPF